ncbi:MAG: hypothetical protein LKG11_00895 [Bacilli bacterium]|jgi:hypothetical protein|nr:hypothetical protein [Bacilli bacterium]
MKRKGINREELRAKIAYFSDKYGNIADEMGITRQCLNSKMNGKCRFNENDVSFLVSRYGTGILFLDRSVRKCER